MVIRKIINGFVVQSYDSETCQCTDQEFVAGEVEYNDEFGDPIDDIPDLEDCEVILVQPGVLLEDDDKALDCDTRIDPAMQEWADDAQQSLDRLFDKD